MRQAFKHPPFTINEKGWGEFDMQIALTPIGASKAGEQVVAHDLNFQQEHYESTHPVTFRNPKGQLLEVLRESGPVGDEGKTNGVGAGAAPKEKKARKSGNRNVDMEKLAEALPMLGEEDLLQVVQMVHDNKSDDTYTKNDIDSESPLEHSEAEMLESMRLWDAGLTSFTDGEFHVDLYTLPDPLIKMLWDYTTSRVDMGAVA